MYYIGVTLEVLLVELAGVAAIAGIMYGYWNVMTKNKKADA